MFFSIFFGIPLGFFAAKRYGGFFDHFSLFASLLGISIPIFVLAIILKYIFAVKLGWLPTVGRMSVLINIDHPTNFYLLDAHPRGRSRSLLGHGQASDPARDRARLDPTRDHRADHTRVCPRRPERGLRPDGAGEGRRSANGRHEAHPPQRDAADRRRSSASRAGLLLSGAVLTETVFASPASARWLFDAIRARNYPVLQGGILFIAFVFVLVNLIVDLSYGFLNPRIRLS